LKSAEPRKDLTCLVLNRKAGESITIGTQQEILVEIMITHVSNGRTQLKFVAPKNIKIFRTEMLEEIQAAPHSD
jgi:carbon storage regulator CsrA